MDSTGVPETPTYDADMDVNLSPNTVASNNAPSLVSDDSEYDDSDDGSASDASDAMETESVSDVAEINIDDESDAREDTPRPVHLRGGSASKTAKIKKDESRHVTFVIPSPVPTNTKGGRRKKI
jgi:ADA HAT complex component 1